MGALAVNQLLVNSQDKGVELTLETAPLENQVWSAQNLVARVRTSQVLPKPFILTGSTGRC